MFNNFLEGILSMNLKDDSFEMASNCCSNKEDNFKDNNDNCCDSSNCDCGEDCDCNCSCKDDCKCKCKKSLNDNSCCSTSNDNCCDSSNCSDQTELILNKKIIELEKENEKLKNDYLLKQADFENYRKRMLKEKSEITLDANRKLLSDIILIIDDFKRAINSSKDSEDFKSFFNGIKIIEDQFAKVLDSKWHLRLIDALDKDFDPVFHEAISVDENKITDTQKVLEVYQDGYIFNNKVLRPSKVKVSLKKSN